VSTNSFINSLHLADNSLILGQRNSEWCGHGPVLEQDIAITNISLDLFGQARNFYQYAAVLYNTFAKEEKEAVGAYLPNAWRDFDRELEEDDLAFLRDERQYLNLLITELPNGDWAQTILRQFFFSAYQQLLYTELIKSNDQQLSAIAEKSLKEVAYHVRWSSEWVIRLGDGTEESHNRMLKALDELWMFTGELFITGEYELVDIALLKNEWLKKVELNFAEATLQIPEQKWMQRGGKQGQHTEHLGFLLTEMQYLQRTYPNAKW
jgi:ring-1,2-phenylacetyl-CoA epoxidase subunit PaaC